ncbi:MAG: AMP-binding protein, partial [Coxiellaceae bacterium]|nr:AMP-binding protein [Coxiellaceae bacterium]
MTIDSNDKALLVSLLYRNEKERANHIILRQPIDRQFRDFTWKEAIDQARRMVTFLHEQGIQRGDRISVLSKNCAEWLITDYACMIGGFILTPIYATQRDEDIYYVLKHSESKLLFVGKLDNWQAQAPGIPEDIITVSFPYDGGMPCDFAWDQIMQQYSPYPDSPLPKGDDLWSILYTSGTTGSPKGVMYSYEQMADVSHYGVSDLGVLGLPDDNRLISYLPLAHIAERFGVELVSLGLDEKHFTVYFVESLETFAEDIQKAHPTIFFAVPRIWTVFQMGILSKMPKEKLDRLL